MRFVFKDFKRFIAYLNVSHGAEPRLNSLCLCHSELDELCFIKNNKYSEQNPVIMQKMDQSEFWVIYDKYFPFCSCIEIPFL